MEFFTCISTCKNSFAIFSTDLKSATNLYFDTRLKCGNKKIMFLILAILQSVKPNAHKTAQKMKNALILHQFPVKCWYPNMYNYLCT